MDYENRKVPDHVNRNTDHPAKEFFLLGAGLLLAGILLVVMTGWAGGWLARFIPFSYEQDIAQSFADELDKDNDSPVEKYLQAMTDELSKSIDLPAGMTITAHYVDDDMVNAFATLGGHIMIFRGLLEAAPNENALAMVISHEIAHVKHRDPIVAIGRGVLAQSVLSLVIGTSGNELAGKMLGNAGLLTTLNFSRRQETAADREGLAAIYQRYGHVNGASRIFEKFLEIEEEQGSSMPEMFQTHPASAKRIRKLAAQATDNNWPQEGDLTLMPVFDN
ncbi:MAG: M48 family metallopeptidase [Gammaproteobacteria bacterium]